MEYKDWPTIIITPDLCVPPVAYYLTPCIVKKKPVYKIKVRETERMLCKVVSLKSNIVAKHNLIILAWPFETIFMLPVIHENFLDRDGKPGKCDYNFVMLKKICPNIVT